MSLFAETGGRDSRFRPLRDCARRAVSRFCDQHISGV